MSSPGEDEATLHSASVGSPIPPPVGHPFLVLRDGDTEAGVRPYQFDDSLIQRACETNREQWILYRPSRAMVVIGRGSHLDREIELERCNAGGVPIFRRYGGGCSVVLDPGNLVVSIVYPTATLGSSRHYFDKASHWVIDALRRIGVADARRDGISDLVVGDRKIGGSCIYQTKAFVYFSTTILVDPDLSTISACLKHPPREPGYRQGRRHDSFLMGIGELVGERTPIIARNLGQTLERIPL